MATEVAQLTEDQSRSLQVADYWKQEIKQAEDDRRIWIKRCEKIIDQYRDDRPATASPQGQEQGLDNKRLNLFWANVETLKPATYSREPVPICERRFLDKDPIGRAASSILERALRYEIKSCGFHSAFRQVRDDYLLVGRGVPWVYYEPAFSEPVSLSTKGYDEITDDSGEDIQPEKENAALQSQEKSWECLKVGYVHYKDYLILGRPRVWEEVETIAKRVYLSREDCIRAFGDEIGKAIPLDAEEIREHERDKTRYGRAGTQDNINQKATVYEIWCKFDKTVYWINKNYDYVLKQIPDPLKLECFFPSPKPAFTNTTNDTLIPVPDYAEAQDQYVQINELTRRIDVITAALQVKGWYDASARELQNLFTETKEPQLFPVNEYATIMGQGGLKSMIEFIPLENMAVVLKTLIETRSQIMQDLDRITGVWDILRGETNPNETLGAQQLKQQNGVGRLQERQEEFARLAHETLQIMGELIAEHFSPQTLIQVSGAMYDEALLPRDDTNPMMGHNGGPPMNPQGAQPAPMGQPGALPAAMPPVDPMQQRMGMIMQAIQLLKDEKLRGFRISIETDSTIQPDAAQEKAARIEFITAVTQFLGQAQEIGAANPAIIPLLGDILLFGVRGFRVGRQLESSIEEYTDQAAQMAKQMMANPQPNPEEIKAKAEEQKNQMEMAKSQMEIQSRQQEMAHESRMKEMDYKLKQLELQMKMIEAMAPEEETDPVTGEVRKKENPALKQMFEGMAQEQATMQRIEKLLKRATAEKEVVRDETGRAIGVRPKEVEEVEEPAGGNGRLEELLTTVEQAVAKSGNKSISRGANGQLTAT